MDNEKLDYTNLTISEATAIQNRLRSSLTQLPLLKEIKTIAGADISLNRFSDIYAGIIVLDFNTLKPLSYSLVKSKTSFPYIPGFLAFREVPALVEAFRQMTVKPDVIMVDGHGIAHPRRLGIAAHLGALINIPTLGCAKKKLYGSFEEPLAAKNSFSPLMQKDELLGYVLRTKNNVKPVYISPGNQLSMHDSLQIAMHCTGSYRLPEPTRRAHEFVNLFRTGHLKEGFFQVTNETLF
ncbi:deoxyribonuclease V [Olivibacter sp. CPCC 100613]|uniref:deoxyribonuclease V n=1 Tax=Olivibacter sp. CPCC 100613 TaxID=3079931 RepID=UPI002FF4D4B1